MSVIESKEATFLKHHLPCQSFVMPPPQQINGDGTVSISVSCQKCKDEAILTIPDHLHWDVLYDLAATAEVTITAEIERRLARILSRLVEPRTRSTARSSYTDAEILRLLSDNHSLTSEQAQVVASMLTTLPRDVVDRVVSHCYIVTNTPDKWAFMFSPSHAPHVKAAIFLSTDLWARPFEFIQKCLLHEIAHVELQHRPMLCRNFDSQWDRDVQEDEAEELVSRWLGGRHILFGGLKLSPHGQLNNKTSMADRTSFSTQRVEEGKSLLRCI